MITTDAQLDGKDLARLFDRLPNVVFFIKDRQGRYLQVNQTLADRCGLDDKSALIGRTPSQLFGEELGRSFEEQDRRVLENAHNVRDQLELHNYPGGRVGWCLTNKFTLHDPDGRVTGLTGISQDLPAPNFAQTDATNIARVIDHAVNSLESAPRIADLCAIAGLSPYRLDRRMRAIFGLTTGQWLIQQRIERARSMLSAGEEAIAEVAISCGYSDQSAFTRQFRRATGLTPSQYRREAKGTA